MTTGLGYLHANRGNYTEARRYFLLAAEKGDLDAIFNLGAISYSGYGMERNLTDAVHWYQLAAARRHLGACTILGKMYLAGACLKVPHEALACGLGGRSHLSHGLWREGPFPVGVSCLCFVSGRGPDGCPKGERGIRTNSTPLAAGFLCRRGCPAIV